MAGRYGVSAPTHDGFDQFAPITKDRENPIARRGTVAIKIRREEMRRGWVTGEAPVGL